VRVLLYLLFAVGGILILLALAIVFFGDDNSVPVAPQSPAVDLSSAQPAPDVESDSQTAPPPLAGVTPPKVPEQLAIDMARVKPDGSALIVGTGVPKARIRAFEGKVVLGETVADAAGEWVLVLEKSLAPGQHLITVSSERADGTKDLAEVNLAVEIYQDQGTKPLVAVLPQSTADTPVLMQSPDDAAVTAGDAAGRTDTPPSQDSAASLETAQTDAMTPAGAAADVEAGTLVKDSVDNAAGITTIAPTAIVWRDGGEVLISGTSSGGIRVAATVDDGVFGEALVLADGKWRITGKFDMAKSLYRLEFRLFDSSDDVVAHYALPLKSRDLAKGMDGSPLVVVNKGDALWRIAYRQLGEGVRYVDIVRRNSVDIGNPDLIYPNQIFAVPK
jgi:nucleoid-associated protein YgaU